MQEREAIRGGTEPAEPESRAKPVENRPTAWQFRLAVLAHHRIAYRVAHALLRNAPDAEDATQEAFMRFWQHGGGVERPREWLLRVVRNACLDRLRVAGRWVDHGGEDPALLLAEERDPAWHYRQAELKDRLHALIHALPEPQRSLIVLFDLHGVRGDACARILGLSANQVKVYLHRARRRLRLSLEQSS